MKRIISIAYFVGWLTYFLVFIAKKTGFQLPDFFQFYYADLLAIPLVLGAASYLLKRYTSNATFSLSIPKVLFACAYFSVLFEWILPMYSSSYTSDPMDVICYFIGGGLYYHLTGFVTEKHLTDAPTI